MKYLILVADPAPGYALQTVLVNAEDFDPTEENPADYFRPGTFTDARTGGSIEIAGDTHLLDIVYNSD